MLFKSLSSALLVGAMIGAPTPALAQAATAAPKIADPEVAHIVVTANTIDVDQGNLALLRSSNAEVKKFAQTMVTDHNAVNAAAAALATKLNVTPKNNAISESLNKEAVAVRDTLSKLSGVAFDRAYINREAAFHAAVIDALDKVLLPATSNAELKATLVKYRPLFVAHLEHARALQKTFAQ